MNKLKLIAVSALAVAAAGANAESHFDGMNAGVRAEYNFDEQKLKSEKVQGLDIKFKPKGMGGSILFGYMNDLGNDVVIGTELIAGYQNAKSKKETKVNGVNLKGTYNNKFNFGADFLAGYKFMPELLGYGRLGLHMHQSDFRLDSTQGGTKTEKKTQYVPNVHVGLGVKYAVAQDFILDTGYTFAYDLKDKEYFSGDNKVKFEKSASHKIHVGMTFKI